MQPTVVEDKLSVASQQPASLNTGSPEHSAQGARWYILRCGAGLEFRARDALSDSGFSAFVPVERKWRVTLFRRRAIEAEYPRFPRYLFLRAVPPCWPDWRAWPISVLIRGVLAMGGEPIALVPGEIERLRAEDGQAVPHVESVPLHRAFAPGDQVRVTAGGWRDWVVRIDALNEAGAHISVPLFGRCEPTVVPLTWLEAA